MRVFWYTPFVALFLTALYFMGWALVWISLVSFGTAFGLLGLIYCAHRASGRRLMVPSFFGDYKEQADAELARKGNEVIGSVYDLRTNTRTPIRRKDVTFPSIGGSGSFRR